MEKVTKAALIRCAAEETGVSKKDTGLVVNKFIDLMADALAVGYEVSIMGFIKLTPHKVGERTYHTPNGGTSISPAHTRVSVRFSKTLKERINK